MPFCSSCQYEYVEGIKCCPECGAALTPGSRPEPVKKAGPGYVRLTTFTDPAAALVVRAALEEAGIPVILQTHGPISGELAVVAGDITEDFANLHVPEDRLEAAQRVLEALENAPPTWPPGMEPEE